jgi:cytochrome c biogenesis protein CcmG/thiol:disulfide interchange protein DsbE
LGNIFKTTNHQVTDVTGEIDMTDVISGNEIQEERSRGWGPILVWVVVLGILLVLGLSLIRSNQGSVAVGQDVPDFVLITFDGDQLEIVSLRGKVVIINFWASWCKPCMQEAAELEQAYQSFKNEDVIFLGVDYSDTETEALGYLSEFNITYPNGPDLGTRISQAFRIRGVPETYIVGADGVLVDVKIGPYTSLDEIKDAVINAMQQ